MVPYVTVKLNLRSAKTEQREVRAIFTSFLGAMLFFVQQIKSLEIQKCSIATEKVPCRGIDNFFMQNFAYIRQMQIKP